MRVLVTGANGFVGKHLTGYLTRKGFEVFSTDIRNARFSGDILDEAFVFSELASVEFDAIVHLAAAANIKRSIEDPLTTFRVNCGGLLNALELAYRKKVSRFIYASSANVYGVPIELPVKETTPFNPRTPYDYSKVIGEYLVKSYGENKRLRFYITRSWKLFGEYDSPTSAIPNFIKLCLRNEPLPLYNGGRDSTAPLHAENYARLVELLLTKDIDSGEAFNVGGDRVLSIREIAELIKKLTGSKSEVLLLPPRTALEEKPMESYPSLEKIRTTLGFEPLVSLEEGLKRTIKWAKLQEGM